MEGVKHFPCMICSPPGADEPNSRAAYLTYEELHVKTRISLSTLRRLVREGCIPFFQPGGPRTRILFPADIVERLLTPTQNTRKLQDTQEHAALPTVRRGPKPKWLRWEPTAERQQVEN